MYYSLRPKLSTKSCFMKQKHHLQIGVTQHKNAATLLSTSGINTTRQQFQMRYITLFQLKGLKSYQLSKFECVDFNSKIDFTFLLWLMTFELLELKQSYILHFKVLTCGINALGAQWRSCIFILCYTYLKLALLLHKTALS